MRALLYQLWCDDGGFIISVEMLFIVVILVIGVIAGVAALRAAVTTQLASTGAAISGLNEGYDFVGVGSITGASNGSWVKHVNLGVNVGAANAAAGSTAVQPAIQPGATP